MKAPRVLAMMLLVAIVLRLVFQPVAAFGSSGSSERWAGIAGEEAPKTTARSMTANAQLIESLEAFKAAVLAKIDSDVETTARSFWDAYNIQQSRKVADFVLAPLTVIEQAIGTVAFAKNVPEIFAGIERAENFLQVVSLFMGLSQLNQVGRNPQVAIDGPAYSSLLKAMLTEAAASTQPGEYATTVKLHLYGIGGRRSPVGVPLKVTDADGPRREMVWGAEAVKRRASDRINALIRELTETPVGTIVQAEAAHTHLTTFTDAVKRSRMDSVTVISSVVSPTKGGSSDLLWEGGSIGALEQVRREALAQYDNDLHLEQVSVLTSAVKAGTQVTSLTVGYKTPSGNLLKEVQRDVITPGTVLVNTLTKTYATGARYQVAALPHEMILSLPGELANTWKLLDGIVAVIRASLNEAKVVAKPKDALPSVQQSTKPEFSGVLTPGMSYLGVSLRPDGKLLFHDQEIGHLPDASAAQAHLSSPSPRRGLIYVAHKDWDKGAIQGSIVDPSNKRVILRSILPADRILGETMAERVVQPCEDISWSLDEDYALIVQCGEVIRNFIVLDLVKGRSHIFTVGKLERNDCEWQSFDLGGSSWMSSTTFRLRLAIDKNPWADHPCEATSYPSYDLLVNARTLEVKQSGTTDAAKTAVKHDDSTTAEKAAASLYAQPTLPDFLTKTTVDPETLVRFSLVKGYECKRDTSASVAAIGEMPKSTDFLDDALVRAILKKGVDYFIAQCPTYWERTAVDLKVYLFNGPVGKPDRNLYGGPDIEGFAVVGAFWSGTRFQKMEFYKNLPLMQLQAEQQRERKEEERRRRETEAAARPARLQEIEALRRSGPKSLFALVQALGDKDAEVRGKASDALREVARAGFSELGLDAKDAIPALTEASKKGDKGAQYALRRIKFPSSPSDICAGELSKGWGGVLASNRYHRPCPKEGDEEKKAAADKLALAFMKRHAVSKAVTCDAIHRNPFTYDGVTVMLQSMWFSEMLARDRALFEHGECMAAVSGIPHNLLPNERVRVIFAGRVVGNTEVQYGPLTVRVPDLRYVGIHICKDPNCDDFFGPESMR